MLNLFERARARFPSTDSFKLTESLMAEIKSDVRSAKATPVRIASRLGVPIALVRFIMNETPNGTSIFSVLSEDGWGRSELRDFIITRRSASAGEWPKEDEAVIQRHRDAYDSGLIEMAQGRDGNFIILYAFPRNKPAKRDYAYFASMTELFHD